MKEHFELIRPFRPGSHRGLRGAPDARDADISDAPRVPCGTHDARALGDLSSGLGALLLPHSGPEKISVCHVSGVRHGIRVNEAILLLS